MPADLLVPTDVAEANAAMDRQAAEATRHIAEAARLGEDLRHIDPYLSLHWVPEDATEFDDPGRWHVKKEIPGDFDEWWPLIGPNGEYREPGAWVLDVLTANDMWNPRVHRSRREAREKHREAKRRAKARDTEQRRDEMALANRAAKRIRGDAGMEKRTDLLLPPSVAAEREAKVKAEQARRLASVDEKRGEPA